MKLLKTDGTILDKVYRQQNPKWPLHLAAFIVVLFLGMAAIEWYGNSRAPKTEQAAMERMLGTWTYIEPIDFNSDPFPFEWVKWVVRPDGTMTVWHASPTADGWGEGVTGKYQITSGKFANNGERWFGIEDPAQSYMVGIVESGSIVLHMLPAANRNVGIMVRGDKNPFSK